MVVAESERAEASKALELGNLLVLHFVDQKMSQGYKFHFLVRVAITAHIAKGMDTREVWRIGPFFATNLPQLGE